MSVTGVPSTFSLDSVGDDDVIGFDAKNVEANDSHAKSIRFTLPDIMGSGVSRGGGGDSDDIRKPTS